MVFKYYKVLEFPKQGVLQKNVFVKLNNIPFPFIYFCNIRCVVNCQRRLSKADLQILV